MKQICGMNVRREFRGPASMLASVIDENNQQHTAIVFHEQFHNHPALNDSLFIILDFLQAPFVSGLADLLVHEPENGAFIFGTGPGSSIAELIRTATDLSIQTGARTGLEFMYKVGQVLVEASYAAQTYTVFSHGGLTPWRIVLKDNGEVSIIGYALPQVEMLDFQRDERMKPTEDSFRYCPPERIRSEPEDLSSDLFSLGLIAFELMTLMPMYDGTVDAIRQRAIRGDASQQIYGAREVIPVSVAKLLERTLQSNRDARYLSGREFLDSVKRLLDDPNIRGISLADLLSKIKQQANQEMAPLPSSDQDFRTALLSRDKLLQNRELYTSQRAAREEVVLGQGVALNPHQAPPPEEIAELLESQSVITTSGSSWKPVERRRSSEPEESLEVPVAAKPVASPERERSVGRRGGASDILKMLRESQRSLKHDALNIPEPAQEAPEVPSFIKKIKRSRNKTKPALSENTDKADSNLQSTNTEEQTDSNEVQVSAPAEPTPKRRHVKAATNIPSTKRDAQEQKKREEPETEENDSTAIHSRKALIEPVRQASKKEKPKNKRKKARSTESIEENVSEAPKAPLASYEPPSQMIEAEHDILHARRFVFSPFVVGSKSVERYIIHRNPDGEPMRFRAAAHNTTAEFVSNLLTNRLIAIRTNLAGQLLGWYRFKQSGKIYKGSERMGDLDPRLPIELFCVQNALMWANIEISDKQSIQYRAQVGLAVPILSLIDHLIGVYELEHAGWGLEVNGQVAGIHDILWDYLSDTSGHWLQLKLFLMEKKT